jgi:RNA polymerase sigma factor (sigma-70 family)
MIYEELVKKVSPTLKRITHRLNGRFTFFNEDDLYQEALLHLWLDFQAGKLEDKTQSYVLQGCYFYLKNHIRTIKDKLRPLSLDELVGDREESRSFEELLCDERSGAFPEVISDRMLSDTLMNNGFTTREKDLMGLLMQDLTVREIGKRMGISHVAVLKLRDNLRTKCRKYQDEK